MAQSCFSGLCRYRSCGCCLTWPPQCCRDSPGNLGRSPSPWICLGWTGPCRRSLPEAPGRHEWVYTSNKINHTLVSLNTTKLSDRSVQNIWGSVWLFTFLGPTTHNPVLTTWASVTVLLLHLPTTPREQIFFLAVYGEVGTEVFKVWHSHPCPWDKME